VAEFGKGMNMQAPEDRAGTIARYQEGPVVLEQIVKDLAASDLNAVPSSGGWTIREIVHHIADGDDIWTIGLKIAMGNDGVEFALGWYWAFPQETWADRWGYTRRSICESLNLLKSTRAHIVQLIGSAPEGWDYGVIVRTPKGEVERVPVGFIVQMQGDHVFHHIERIRAILRERSGT
jgi:hypothetical protein